MSEMMNCFVMHGIGKVGMIKKPIPRPGPIDAIIRTTAALICTSDTHTVAGAIGDRHGLTLGGDPTWPRYDCHPAVEDVKRDLGFPADHRPDFAFQDGHFLGAIHAVNLEVECG